MSTITRHSIEGKPVLHLIEDIVLIDAKGQEKKLKAKIDTGADSSSLDISFANELSLGPIMHTKEVKSSHGKSTRAVVKLSITMAGKKVFANFNLYDRSHMKYPVLIGKDVLKQGFLIDPSRGQK